jgi:hypothetical protein
MVAFAGPLYSVISLATSEWRCSVISLATSEWRCSGLPQCRDHDCLHLIDADSERLARPGLADQPIQPVGGEPLTPLSGRPPRSETPPALQAPAHPGPQDRPGPMSPDETDHRRTTSRDPHNGYTPPTVHHPPHERRDPLCGGVAGRRPADRAGIYQTKASTTCWGWSATD